MIPHKKIYPIGNKTKPKTRRRRVRSQSLSLQTPRSRAKAWERRQLLVKAEIQVLVQHPRRLIRQSQAGRFNSQEEGGGGGREEEEEEFSVVVSQNREVQRPGGDRVARAAPGTRPRRLAGWLAQRVQQKFQQ